MPTMHIIGAGLAGLSCAVELTKAGFRVKLWEQAARAGGRCRSFHDQALDCVIDNGNHLLLSGNMAALAFLDAIGARDRLTGPAEACFPFYDVKTGERWVIHPNRGKLPWWTLMPGRRAPGTGVGDYLAGARLLRADGNATVCEALRVNGAALERFWEPLVVAALNTAPQAAAASLLTPVLRETFAKGAAACRPLIARTGLSDTFVDPALDWLVRRGAEIVYGTRASALRVDGDRIAAIEVARQPVCLEPDDAVVLAVPASVATDLVPDLVAPDAFAPIVNVHFRLHAPIEPPGGCPILGIIGGTAQWLFIRGDVVSVTVSAAGELTDAPAAGIAEAAWHDVASALSLPVEPKPRWRVIKERRATFLQTPEQVAKRPQTGTRLRNLALAGDWSDTGLPATIEGAIRSGVAAARTIRRGSS